MKILVLIFIILISFSNYSQNLSEEDLQRLESFNINLTDYNLNDDQILIDFNSILENDTRRRRTKTAGIVFTSLSILSILYGSYIINENKGSGIGESIGNMFVVGGALSGGVSVYLFFTSGKRKKKRNQLIEVYN